MSLKDLVKKYLNREPEIESIRPPVVTIKYNGDIEALMEKARHQVLHMDFAKLELDLARVHGFRFFGNTPWSRPDRVETGRLSSARPPLSHEPRYGISPTWRMLYGLMKRRFLFVNSQNTLIYVDQSTVQDRVMETGKVVNVGVPFIGGLLEPGWRVEAYHRRYYYDEAAQETRLLTGAEAEKRLPAAVTFLYPNGSTATLDYLNEPEVAGGETTVTIHTPYGFYARGVARCAPDDQFDKKAGREIALARAVNNLNEVMNS